MVCHECLMRDASREPAAGLCRFCFVALCKPHLVELFQDPPSVPQLTCRHRPASVPPDIGWAQPAQRPQIAADVVVPAERNGVARTAVRPLRRATGAAPA
jgi:hypothetical protein